MLFNDRYSFDPLKDLLAEGPNARIFKAFDILLQRDICLKLFRKEFAASSPVIQQLNRAGIFFHPNICAFYDLIELSTSNVLGEKEIQPVGILEYNNCGTLTTFLKNNQDFDLIKKLIKDILKGLAYLHSLDNPHLDLKPNNILIKKVVDIPVAKISDFLNSVNIPSSHAFSSTTNSSLAYKAPEYFSNDLMQLNYKADIWSLGVIVYEIITGTMLFADTNDTPEKIIKNILLEDYQHKLAALPFPYQNFVLKCLERDSAQRKVSLEELTTILDNTNNISELKPLNLTKEIASPTLEKPLIENEVEPTVVNIKAIKNKEIPATFDPPLIAENFPIQKPFVNKSSKGITLENTETTTQKKSRLLIPLILASLFILCFGIVTYYFIFDKNNLESKQIISENLTLIGAKKNTLPITIIVDTISQKTTSGDSLKHLIVASNSTIQITPIPFPKTSPVVTPAVTPFLPSLSDYGTLYTGKIYNFNLTNKEGKEYSLWSYSSKINEVEINNFNLTPIAEGNLTIVVLDKKDRTKIIEKTYSIKSKPLLVATLGDDLNGGYASAQTVISKLSMQVKADGKPMQVKSFRLSCASGTCSVTESQGGFFNSSIVQFLRKSRAGEKIYFDNIRALDKEGEEYQVKDFSLTLTDSFIH